MAAVQAFNARRLLWDDVRGLFETFDLLLTPTVAVPPFSIDIAGPETVGDRTGLKANDWVAFTFPFNLTGQPAATINCGFTAEGLPVGLQIVGRRNDEATVLRAAAAFEDALGLADEKPDLGWAEG